MKSHAQYIIREFVFPEDYQQVYTMWSQAGPGIHLRHSDESQEIAKKLQRDPDLFLVAEIDRQIVGTVMGGFDGRRGMMYHLAISPPYRKQGIASALVDELESRLRARGCIRYYLLVTPQNQEAICFYENRGWERLELYTYALDLD